METVPLNVAIRYGKSWTADPLRESAARELAILRDDLTLPIDATVAVSAGDDLAPNQIEITIDDKKCENRPVNSGTGSASTPYHLQGLLHANVEELLTPAVVAALWHEWTIDDTALPDSFVRMLRKLVRHRLRVDRIASLAAAWSENDPAVIFDDALSEASRRVRIELNPDRRRELEPELSGPDEMFKLMRDGMFYELGIRCGVVDLVDDAACDPGTLRIRVADLRSPPLVLIPESECLVNDTVERLRLLNITGRKAFNPANGNECALVPVEFKEVCESAGLTTWTPAGYVVLVTSSVIRRSASSFLSADIVAHDLNNLEQAFPVLTNGLRQQLGHSRFAHVLRALLEDEISVRNLPLIIDSILRLPPRTPVDFDKYIVFGSTYGSIRLAHSTPLLLDDVNTVEIAECVRMNLKRYISHKYTRGQNTLIVYLVGPEIENRMREERPLTASERESLLEAVESEVGSLPPTAQSPVLLTTSSVRYRLRQELRGRFAQLAVLSYQELSPDMNIQPIARISLD